MSYVHFDLFSSCLGSFTSYPHQNVQWREKKQQAKETGDRIFLYAPYVISQSVRIFIFRSFYRRQFTHFSYFFLLLLCITASLGCYAQILWWFSTREKKLNEFFHTVFMCVCVVCMRNEFHFICCLMRFYANIQCHKMYDMHIITEVNPTDGKQDIRK